MSEGEATNYTESTGICGEWGFLSQVFGHVIPDPRDFRPKVWRETDGLQGRRSVLAVGGPSARARTSHVDQ
jgi:hypothetical protein